MTDTIREFVTTKGKPVSLHRDAVRVVAMHGQRKGVTVITLESGAWRHVLADYNEVMAWWRGEEAK